MLLLPLLSTSKIQIHDHVTLSTHLNVIFVTVCVMDRVNFIRLLVLIQHELLDDRAGLCSVMEASSGFIILLHTVTHRYVCMYALSIQNMLHNHKHLKSNMYTLTSEIPMNCVKHVCI